MSNKKSKLVDGNKVRFHTAWDSFKAILIASAIVSFVISLIAGNFGLFIVLVPVLLLPVWICKVVFGALFNIPLKEIGYTMYFDCPYCNQRNCSLIPSIRIRCANCKEEIGYKDSYVYEITEDNKEEFMTEQEKTTAELKKQNSKVDSSSKSNLSELKELKELLDMEAISQEEYNKKKKEILNKN